MCQIVQIYNAKYGVPFLNGIGVNFCKGKDKSIERKLQFAKFVVFHQPYCRNRLSPSLFSIFYSHDPSRIINFTLQKDVSYVNTSTSCLEFVIKR